MSIGAKVVIAIGVGVAITIIAALAFKVVKGRRRLRSLENAAGTRSTWKMSRYGAPVHGVERHEMASDGISASELPWDYSPAELQGSTTHNQP